LIDSFDEPTEDFRACFSDIARANRLFGGVSVVLHHMGSLIGDSIEPVKVLDVATGFGDIPRALLKWSRIRGAPMSITALDANDKVLEIARSESKGDSDFSFVLGDARALPFPDKSFDFAISSLTFHHFDDATAAAILREMSRVSRRGVLVNDLRRGYVPAALIWLVTRVLGMNRLTKNDAPLSVLRSRTMSEYRALAELAGLPSASICKHPFWRAAIVQRSS
jgi:ubiquinone/menaquinone biosynthesis C-methylase UbiE